MSVDKAELRGNAPIELIEALAAIATSRGLDRTELVNSVLTDFVGKVAHRSIVLQRLSRGNALLSEASAPTQALDL